MRRSLGRNISLLLLWMTLLILFAAGLPAGAAVTQTRTEGIDAFPESYQPYLQALQEAHPAWRFVAFDTGLTWDEVLDGETQVVDNNLVRIASVSSWKSLAEGSFDWETSTFTTFDGNRYNGASREIIAYYMDPRNSLGQLRYLFQFEQLTFDPNTQTEEGVKLILKGTFMKEDTLLPEFSSADDEGAMTYAQAFMAIAAELNVSPYHLAARVRQEQGTSGSSALISGTYEGYEGYYNYFNVSASGSTTTAIIENGLKKAQKEGWDTAYKSLLGGASLIADKYIAKGQDTLYLEKFDVAATGGMYSHQYMQNLSAAYSESVSVYNSYNSMGLLDCSFTFVIPVYRDMPEEACPQPTADGNPNYKLQSLGISDGVLSPDFHRDTLAYTAAMGNDVHTITVSALPYAESATVSGTGSIGLAVGENLISVTVTAERGDTCTYTLQVTRLADGEVIIAMGTTTAAVNLRAGPGTDQEILTTVPAGRTVSILAEENGWYLVIHGEYTGYMSKDYIDVYVPAKGLTLDQSTLAVVAGTPGTLTAITDPDPCDTPILWKTSDASIATVENGVVTGHTTGTAIITAYTDNGLSAACTVTVSEPVLFEGTVAVNTWLNVRPQPSTSATVQGRLSNGTRVSVVEVLESWLRILYEDGTAWVSRSYVESDPVPLESVTLTPDTGTLAPGHTLTLTSTVVPFYTTETLTWHSSNEAVARVEDGVVTAVGEGTAEITLAASGGLSAVCTVTVDFAADSITLDRTQADLLLGETMTLTATMTPADAQEVITWSTSNTVVVTVNDGLVSAVGAGVATVTVTTATGKTAACQITVTPPPAESVSLDQTALLLQPGGTAVLTAAMTPIYAGDTLVWRSSDETVATVEDGTVTALKGGTAVITVTAEPTGKTASCTVTVAAPAESVALDRSELTLYQNATAQLTATLTPAVSTDALVWSSSDEGVATVQNGLVTAVSQGSAVITVTTASGKSATCAVTVQAVPITVTLDQTELTLNQGGTALLTPVLSPAGVTDTLTWRSSDEAVASVQNGTVTAISKGSAVITVTTSSGNTATCTVTVLLPATCVTLNKTDITMTVGETAKLKASITPADSTDSLTWHSSNEAVFTVKDGVVTAAGAGTATLTVSAREGVAATCIVRVKNPVPDKVTSSAFTVQDEYIRKIPLGTTASQLLAGLNESAYCKVYSGSSEVTGSTPVGTGMVVKLLDGSTVKASYTLVVTGDVNGDGEISVTDMIAVKSHLLEKTALSGAAAAAADANGDGEISITDFIQIKSHILGKSQVQAG